MPASILVNTEWRRTIDSLVFQDNANGNSSGPPFFPVRVINNANKINLLSGIYLQTPGKSRKNCGQISVCVGIV